MDPALENVIIAVSTFSRECSAEEVRSLLEDTLCASNSVRKQVINSFRLALANSRASHLHLELVSALGTIGAEKQTNKANQERVMGILLAELSRYVVPWWQKWGGKAEDESYSTTRMLAELAKQLGEVAVRRCKQKKAVEVLAPLLRHKKEEVRKAATLALGKIGETAEGIVLSDLIDILVENRTFHDRSIGLSVVNLDIQHVLSRLESRIAKLLITKWIFEDEPSKKKALWAVLGSMGEPTLKELLLNEKNGVLPMDAVKPLVERIQQIISKREFNTGVKKVPERRVTRALHSRAAA